MGRGEPELHGDCGCNHFIMPISGSAELGRVLLCVFFILSLNKIKRVRVSGREVKNSIYCSCQENESLNDVWGRLIFSQSKTEFVP